MQQYPKWIYHGSEPAKIVRTPEDHAAAGEGWHESPADIPVATPKPATTAPALAAAPAGTEATTTADGTSIEQTEKEGLWNAKAADVLGRLKGAAKATLEKVKAYETERPKGARKGVLKAVDEALATLAGE